MIPRKDICQLEKEEKDRFLYAYSQFVKTDAYTTLIGIRERSRELWRNNHVYLVWHRAYVALFERLLQFHDPLRSTLGNLTVPYLAWEEWDEQTDERFYALVKDPNYTITGDVLAPYVKSGVSGKDAYSITNPLYKPRGAGVPVPNNRSARELINEAVHEHDWRRFTRRMAAMSYMYRFTGGMEFGSTDGISVLSYANADRHLAMWQKAGGQILEADYRSSLPPWTKPQPSFDVLALKDAKDIINGFLVLPSGKSSGSVGSWLSAYDSTSIIIIPSGNADYVCVDVECAELTDEIDTGAKRADEVGIGDRITDIGDKITGAISSSMRMINELPFSSERLLDIDTLNKVTDLIARIYGEIKFRISGNDEDKADLEDIYSVQTFRVPVSAAKVSTYRKMLQLFENSGELDEVIKAYKRAFGATIKPMRSIRSYWRDVTSLVLNPRRFLDRIIGRSRLTIAPRGIVENDGWPVLCQRKFEFKNWGRNVAHVPEFIFFPRSRTGVINIVRKAIENNKKVRCCGFRHTWNDMYSESDQWLISMVNEYSVYDHMDKRSDLQGITFADEDVTWSDGMFTRLVRIGAGTTNEMLRQWCIDRWLNSSNPANDTSLVTLPFNVIMVEITLGGSNAPICHGAGITSSTLSDLVTEVEFVNAIGEIQTVRDPELLKSASGAFGLLGVVLSLTLRLDKLTYARMVPKKIPVLEAVPPPVPKTDTVAPVDPRLVEVYVDNYDKSVQSFIDCCENNYYSEWFWFTGNKDVWVNCWNNDGKLEETKEYPCPVQEDLQHAMAHIAEITNTDFVRHLPPKLQTRLAADMAMMVLPHRKDDNPITTLLINGLHFRRGIHNMRVSDMEFEIPVPMYEQDGHIKYDWRVCMEAWWQVINIVEAEEKQNRYPQRLCLEMRITGGSNVTLAPQYGNQATCSIEVLTLCVHEEDAKETADSIEWNHYKQRVFEAWSSIRDREGRPLLIRSHWAKEWQNLQYKDPDTGELIPIIKYNRDRAYKDAIPKFCRHLEAIAQAGGYDLNDMQKRFSNHLLDSQLFFDM